MGKMMISLDDELEDEWRQFVKEKFGNRRGGLSIATTQAMREFMDKHA